MLKNIRTKTNINSDLFGYSSNEHKANIMKVSKHKQKNWRLSKEHGDIQLIHDSKGVSKDKLRKAFDFGESDQETADAIDSFFAERNNQVIV